MGSKFKNKLVKIDNHVFPSIGEGARYLQLKEMQNKKIISNLSLQVEYELVPAVKRHSKGKNRVVKYIADFVYTKDNKLIVEDYKGKETDVFKLKEKLMLWLLDIEIVKVTDKDVPKMYLAKAKRYLI